MKRAGGAVLAGLLIAGALPPWGWWPLALAGIGLWGWLLVDLKWKSRLGVGALVGLAHFVVALAWVPEFTVPGYPVLVLLETGFWVLASLVARGRWAPVGLAAALTLAEAARYNSPFEGLPLAGVDLGQVGGPFLNAARLAGGYAVTLSAGLLGAGLALAARRQAGVGGVPRSAAAASGRPAARGMVAFVPVTLAVALPLVGWLSPDGDSTGEPLRVAVVQGGGPVGFRGVNTDFGEVLDRHLDATSKIRPPVDLVLWPENAVTPEGPPPAASQIDGSIEKTIGSDPATTPPSQPEIDAVMAAAFRLDAVLVAGLVLDVAPDEFSNEAAAFGRGCCDVVRKAIRVPFGEYIPFRSFFDRFADLSAIPSEARPGSGPGVLDTAEGKFAVSISYEVLFPQRSREAVNLGGQVVLVPTNAASFKRTQVPGQELAAARLRAVETGRWVLQAAPTGYSAVVDHRGRVRQRTGISEQRVLQDVVPRRHGSTPFLVAGPWPTLGLALALVLLANFGSSVTLRDTQEPKLGGGDARRRPDETSGDTPAGTP